MIPSTTRAPHAYSNDGCTVTARARLTLQSFPTNKTLNTGPLPLSSLSEYCNELHTSRKKLHYELYLFFNLHVHMLLSLTFHLQDDMDNVFFGMGIYTIIKLQLSENSYSDPL